MTTSPRTSPSGTSPSRTSPSRTSSSGPEPTPSGPTPSGPSWWRRWRFLVAMTLFGFVPFAAGTVRIVQLASGVPATAESQRYVDSPWPVVLHVVAAFVYWFVGGLQFLPISRRNRTPWHRRAGRALVVPAGLLVAWSGLWMTFIYPPIPGDGALLATMRLVVAAAMTGALLEGVRTAGRRRFPAHRAWMIRAFALGLGAGTQVFTTLPYTAFAGLPTGTTRALLLGLGWVINVVVAEWWLRRRPYAVAARGARGPARGAADSVSPGAPRPA